ncbi:MAG: lamin tail domain-containing protein, partial [Candidatus Binatia bacterium]
TTGQLYTSLTYGGDGGEGLSYSRTSNGGYVWTRAATPGEATRIIKPEQDTFPDRATRQSSVTPFAKATVPPSHQFSEEIVISAVLPNPIGEDTESEFIELHNRGTQTLRLAGWQLDDEEGGSKPFAFPATEALVAGERRAFSRALTGIALNNTADTARLLDPNGAVMSSLTYTEPAEEGVVVHSASGSYGAGEVHEEGERQEEGSVAGVKTTEPTAENNENRDQGTNTAHNDEQEHDLDAQAKEMGQTKHSIFSSERRRELAGPLTVGGLGIGALAWQLVGRGALREPLLRLLVRKK